MLALHNTQALHKTFKPGRRIKLPEGGWASPELGDTWGDWRCDEVAKADPIPAGKQPTGSTVQIVNGAPKRVHTLEDVPPPPTSEELADAFLQGSNRDKALGLVMADLVRQINPALTVAESRTLVRDRFIHHFNNLSSG